MSRRTGVLEWTGAHASRTSATRSAGDIEMHPQLRGDAASRSAANGGSCEPASPPSIVAGGRRSSVIVLTLIADLHSGPRRRSEPPLEIAYSAGIASRALTPA
jgi:hypothetical protein